MPEKSSDPEAIDRETERKIQDYLDEKLRGKYELTPWPQLIVESLLSLTQKFLKSLTVRTSLKRELADHLADATERGLEAGLAPDKALDAAIREFGDPLEVARELRGVHRLTVFDWLGRGFCLILFLVFVFDFQAMSPNNFIAITPALLFLLPMCGIIVASRLAGFSNGEGNLVKREASGQGICLQSKKTRLLFVAFCGAIAMFSFYLTGCSVWLSLFGFLIVFGGMLGTLFSSGDWSWEKTSRSCMFWAMLAVFFMIIDLIFNNISDINAVGHGFAFCLTAFLYYALLVKIQLPVALFMLAAIHFIIWGIASLNGLYNGPSYQGMHSRFYTMGAEIAVAVFLYGWARYGSSGVLRRLPNLAVIAIFLYYVPLLGMFDVAFSVEHQVHLIAASLPFAFYLFYLLPFRRIRGVLGKYAA